MPPRARYSHTSIVARDWRRLAEFYRKVFGCTPRPPERNLQGAWLAELTSLRNPHIRGIHLGLPGCGTAGPTLEIFEYSSTRAVGLPRVNRPGFAHIAFSVPSVPRMLSRLKRSGGSSVGKLVSATIEGVGVINVAYARDPEGNVVELQHWGSARRSGARRRGGARRGGS
jgi:lactoylglutathione lyase